MVDLNTANALSEEQKKTLSWIENLPFSLSKAQSTRLEKLASDPDEKIREVARREWYERHKHMVSVIDRPDGDSEVTFFETPDYEGKASLTD